MKLILKKVNKIRILNLYLNNDINTIVIANQ